ncbi:MAG: ABC transporter permease subunit [Acidilobus sp.]
MARWQAAIMLLPVIFFSGFAMYMVLWNVYISLTNWSLLSPKPKFVGLQTYLSLLQDMIFKLGIKHSVIITLIILALGNLLGIFLAGGLYFLRSNLQRTVYLSVFLYPMTVSSASVGLIAEFLYMRAIGIDWLLMKLHLPQISWLGTETVAQISVSLVELWALSGLATLFYLAAFLGIPKDVIEAARIDGAGGLKILFRIILPNSLSGLIISSALLFLFAFKVFTVPYFLGGGFTNFYLTTATMYIYNAWFGEHFAKASADAVIITAIVTAVIVPYASYLLSRMRR